MNEIKVKDFEKFNMKGSTVDDILGVNNACTSKYHLCVECNKMDLYEYDNIVNISPVLKQMLDENTKMLQTFNHLSKDIFLCLYKENPVIRSEDEIFPSCIFNYKILTELIQDEEFLKLREQCVGDVKLTLMSFSFLQEKLKDVVEEWNDQIKEYFDIVNNSANNTNSLIGMENKIQSINEQAQQILEIMQQKQSTINNPYNTQENIIQTLNEIESLNEQLTNLREQEQLELDYLYDRNKEVISTCNVNIDEGVSMSFANTFTLANEYIQQVQPVINSFGLDIGGNNRIPYDTKIKAIKLLADSEKLNDIIQAIGYVEQILKSGNKKAKVNNGSIIENISVGGNVQDMLPSEKINLSNNTTKKDLYRRISQKQVMQYNKKSLKTKGKGPIIFLGDESGSMEDKEKFLKAIAIIMMKKAVAQGRNFCYIGFSGKIRVPIYVYHDNIDPQSIYDISTKFLCGGTNFEKPLDKALEVLNSSKFKNAGIVMVTDGESSLTDDFLKKYNSTKKAKEFSTLSILINEGSGEVSDATLKKISDEVILLSDLDSRNSINAIKGVFNI